jgi:hypothetical protein
MHKKVSITKEEDGWAGRELFIETSSKVEGDVFIGVDAFEECLDFPLNQEELAEFISELQKFLNPKPNA